MLLLYDIGVRIYYLIILIASVRNTKASKWVSGRKNWKKRLSGKFGSTDRVIWFHCASLGEFEQGRPVIEMIRERYPVYRIVLTFFSPSGFEKRKDFAAVDLVMYLPLDTKSNVKAFLELVPVQIAFFIKYEFWFHYLKELTDKKIPSYLVSGHFNSKQLFFRWYGGWYRSFLKRFTHIFVQDHRSVELLEKYGIYRVSVAGDTRFDRVAAIVGNGSWNKQMAQFLGDLPVLIAGSTWEKDEMIIRKVRSQLKEQLKLVIAPHEPTEQSIRRLQQWFPDNLLFSDLQNDTSMQGAGVLIVDTMGHLSSLYRYGSMAYIGGGFGHGIHNILEATAAGMPVMFGPNYQRFREAVELKSDCAAYVVGHSGDLLAVIRGFIENKELLKERSQRALNYTFSRTGATSRIVDFVFKNNG